MILKIIRLITYCVSRAHRRGLGYRAIADNRARVCIATLFGDHQGHRHILSSCLFRDRYTYVRPENSTSED